MTVAYRATATATISAATEVSTINAPKPTGTVQNDGMLMTVGLTNGGAAATITPPANTWTLVKRTDVGSLTLATYKRVAGASEPANWAIALGANRNVSVAVRSFSGLFNTVPDMVEAWNENSSTVAGTSLTALPVNALAGAWLVVAYLAYHETVGTDLVAATFTPPGSVANERYEMGTYGASGSPTAGQYRVQATEGADASWAGGNTGNLVATTNKAVAGYIAHTIAIRDTMTMPTDLVGAVGV